MLKRSECVLRGSWNAENLAFVLVEGCWGTADMSGNKFEVIEGIEE